MAKSKSTHKPSEKREYTDEERRAICTKCGKEFVRPDYMIKYSVRVCKPCINARHRAAYARSAKQQVSRSTSAAAYRARVRSLRPVCTQS